MNGINYPQLLKDLYDAISEYKKVKKRSDYLIIKTNAWHKVEQQLQRLKEIFPQSN